MYNKSWRDLTLTQLEITLLFKNRMYSITISTVRDLIIYLFHMLQYRIYWDIIGYTWDTTSISRYKFVILSSLSFYNFYLSLYNSQILVFMRLRRMY
jgi:hypothetical protein